MLMLLAVGDCFAKKPADLPEEMIKAGYLYHFGLLAEWPTESQSRELNYCFTGSSQYLAAADALDGKVIRGRSIRARLVDRSGMVDGCDLLYFSEAESADFRRMINSVASLPVLTVTDDDRLAKSGIAIFIRPEGKNLVFEINNQVALDSNIHLSSRLLRLAR